MSVALFLSLTVNVFASTELNRTQLGFYQIKVGPPPTYSRIGSGPTGSGFSIVPSDYDQGGMCWVGSRFQFQSSDLPVDRDWVQLTLYLQFSAANYILPEYRNDEFFPDILYLDNSLVGSGGYENIAYEAMKQLKPVRVSSVINERNATLNIMLTKEQLISISTPRSGGKFYHTWIFPQISSNFMISQLKATSGIEYVQVQSLRWSDTSDLVPIDEQTLQALVQLQSSIDEGFTAVIDGQNQTNEKLGSIDSAINGKVVTPDEESSLSDVKGKLSDHEEADQAINNQISNFQNMTFLDSDGNIIDVDLSNISFPTVEKYFDFSLSGDDVIEGASIFRSTLNGFIGVFGSFIFFPLVLGVIGALLGRNSSA